MFKIGTEVTTKVDLKPDPKTSTPYELNNFIPAGSKGVVIGKYSRESFNKILVDFIIKDKKVSFTVDESLLVTTDCELVEVGTTHKGHTIYRGRGGLNNNVYWSDEIGGGVVVYDSIVDPHSVTLALLFEGFVPHNALSQRELIYKIAGRSCPK